MSNHARVMNRYRIDVADTDQAIDRAVLRRAWAFTSAYRTKLLLNLLTLIGAAGVGVLPPLIFKTLIDRAIPHRNYTEVDLLFLAAVGVALLNSGLGLINRWFSASIGEGLIFDLRVKLYEHVQEMPIGFFARTQTGSLLSRLSNDVVGAQATVTTVATIVSDLMTLTATLVAMLSLSWTVTALALVVVPIFIALDRKLGHRLAQLSRRRMEVNAEMTTTMQERFNISGALLVKLFGRPERELRGFSGSAGRVRDLGVKMALTGRFYFGALALAGTLGVAVVYWLGARSVINRGLTIGTLTALAAYVTRLYDPLTSIASARVDVLSALVSFDRCFEVLDAPVAIKDSPDAENIIDCQGRVDFENVWFRYPPPSSMTVESLEVVTSNIERDDEPSAWILRDVSLTIKPGEMVAVVGHTGAGKTTLASLVSRLYDVEQGAVRLDGHDVKQLTRESLRKAIGVVSQDTHLFHDSIAANMRYAKPEATDDEIVEACTAARIHELIAGLPDAYETIVGERGYRLSGGEKQRIAIARVLLKEPAVVVLDEATAHLDSETEALVQQALVEALRNRSALVIAHRLSTVRAADSIIVLDGGSVVERGTHDALIASGGLYEDLYRTQFAPSVAPVAGKSDAAEREAGESASG